MDMKRVITSLGGVESTPGVLSDACTDQELSDYLSNTVVYATGRSHITVAEVRAQETALPLLDQQCTNRAAIHCQIEDKKALFTDTLQMKASLGDSAAVATVTQLLADIEALKAQL